MDVPPQDEDLPGQDRPTIGRRTRVALAVTVFVGVTVAVVAVVASTRSEPPRRDARRPTPTATPSSVQVPVTSPPPPPCLDVGGSRLNCGVTPSLPAATIAAVRTVLPAASVVVASTVVGRNGRVYSRRATVRGADASTLQLRVGPPTGQLSVITVPSSTAPTLITFDTDVGRHHVTVTFRAGPRQRTPTVAALRRLAQDPRLTAL